MVYIDISTAVHSRAGLGRYAAKLADSIAHERPDQVALFHNNDGTGKVPAALAHLPRRSIDIGFKPWRMAVWAAQVGRIGFNRLVPGASLFHSTEHLLMPMRNVPTILTVHDLIYKLFPEYHKSLNYYYLNAAMPIYCKRATAIITVSEASKQDIVEHYQIDPAKIHVVQEAASDLFRPATADKIEAVRQKHNLPDQYLLHVSTIEPRKNLDRLVDALLVARQTLPDLHLVLVGAKGWLYEDFFARLEHENLTHIVRPLGWVDDEDLPAVINGAALAVQPSLYEGFGLPILEHMACGQAVACSNRSSLPEVGGEAAAYFDPENIEEMAAVIVRLLTHADELSTRRSMGLAQAGQFSWQRAARETIEIYDYLLEKHGRHQ